MPASKKMAPAPGAKRDASIPPKRETTAAPRREATLPPKPEGTLPPGSVVGGRRTTKSVELFQRACELMPGGVNSPVRAFRSVGGTPVFFKSGQGAEFVDVDGNHYLDFCQSWGPLILGHAHPRVVEAVQQAASEGLSFGAPNAREVQLAERVLSAFPGFDRVRFVSSGTEAVMSACRLARGVTGRPLILKFEGCYHGHVDSLLVKAGSGLVTQGISDSAGIPPELANLTIVVPLDDEAALDRAFDQHGPRLAAAIIEPMPANNGLLLQRAEFLARIRERCNQAGAMLIFDEVISGFRLRFGGYGQDVGIRPDFVTLGKIVGGGLPVGAFVGRKEHMEQLAPLGPVYQAGTLSGNPVAMAAGRACLDELASGNAYSELEAQGQKLDERFAAIQKEVPWFQWTRRGSVFWLYLAEGPLPRRTDAISPKAKERYVSLYPRLLDRGIYLAPSAFEVAFLSTAHTPAHLERLADALEVNCLVLHREQGGG
jgi:glutamate-1-semialdehyde 2,1-aminomutase